MLTVRGFNIKDIWVGDSFTMHGEITLFDLGQAFRGAFELSKIPHERHSFDLIMHGTSGYVAHEYRSQVRLDQETGLRDTSHTTIQHFCMLAAANFGSGLV